ncbi:MAG: glycosyltransferase family 4 protein [Mariniphaga sp.]|nr:glycosyltransferase family 4 protein [Mariniphaga sp.]
MNIKKHFYFFSMNDFSLISGGPIRMIGIIEALASKGHDVTLISNTKEKNRFPQTVKHIFINKNLSKNERRIIQFILAILPFIFVKMLLNRLCNHFDQIFTENLLSNKEIIFFEYFDNAIGYLFKKCGLIDSCINDTHGIAPLEFWYKKQTTVIGTFIKHTKFIISKLLDYKVYKLVDGLIVITQSLKNYLVSEYPFLEKKRIYIVADGISKSLSEQKIDYSLIATLKKKYNIDNKTKVVLFVGSFKNFGGVPDLVKAFIKIHDIYHDLKLLLIGGGEDYDYVKKLIENNSIADKIILLGTTKYDKLKSYQMLSDIIVCPDIKHPFTDMIIHTKYFESLYSGKVVINGNFTAVRAINDNEQLSLLFEPSDVSDLASKLIYALDNLDVLSDKYKNNTEMISKLYGYDSFVNELL